MKKPLLTIVALVLLLSCNRDKDPRPNIIIFFTDDQGYADLGCYGAEGYKTPNLDALASEGIRFTDFYVPATVCTPSRAGLLTGRYPIRSGLHEAVIFPYSDHGLKAEEYTMAEMLGDAGYETAAIGKWHLGHSKEEYHPNEQGFDYFFGVPYSNDMDSYYYKHNDFQSPPLPVYRNTELIEEGPDQKYLTRMFTEEAIGFIKRKRTNPFFLYLPHSMPHRPLHVSEAYDGLSELGLFGDVIMELDWSAGELVKCLKEEGIYENTIFLFTSDNGPDVGSALPLRGKKASTWEGGQREPGILVWPSRIPGAIVCEDMITTLDLFPTFASICGGDIPDELKLDGLDISETLFNMGGVRIEKRPFFYYGRNGDLEAVRLDNYKLHVSKRGLKDFIPALYNLDNDISEQNNIASAYPDIVHMLQSKIDEFEDSLKYD